MRFRRPMIAVVLIILLASLVAFDRSPATTTAYVLFSPKGGCTDRIVKEIGHAEDKVRVQAYSFTSAPIAKAILDAKKRGVACEVILDKSQESHKYSSITFFANQGIPVLIDDRHAIAHNKIIIIDDMTVITGSFNFTKQAEEANAENVLILRGSPDLADAYVKNYIEHRAHARPCIMVRAEADDPPKAEAGEAPRAEADAVVYVTPSGTRYHSQGCESLDGAGRAIALSRAVEQYRPCSKCKPPK